MAGWNNKENAHVYINNPRARARPCACMRCC